MRDARIPLGTQPIVDSAATRPLGVSARALGIGLCGVAITCVVVCYAELVVAQIQIGFLQLPPVAVALLVVMAGGQMLLRRLHPRLALRTHEMAVIHVMVVLAAMISSRGLLEKLIALLLVPNYYMGFGPWRKLLYPSIPRWAVPWDPAGPDQQPVTSRFFIGLQPGEQIPWALWVMPLAAWAVFVGLMFGAYLCLAAILRRQWVENERLSFPLVQLPLEIIRGASADDRTGFLRNGLTWAGFAVPGLVFAFNGLHQWSPTVPEVTLQLRLVDYVAPAAWNQNVSWLLFVSFAAIGFFYLLPTEILFSLWFFYGLLQAANVVLGALGHTPEGMPEYPCPAFAGYQVMGAYVALALYLAWSARPHLRTVCRAAFSRRADDSGEMLPYRHAFWGLAACVLLAAGWLQALGMAYWFALFQLVVLLGVVGVVMARSTAECGMLMTETSFRPTDMYRLVADARGLSAGTISSTAFFDAAFARDQRGLILTGVLDGLRLGDSVQLRRRALLGAICAGIVAAVLIGGYLHIVLPYRIGGLSMYRYVYADSPLMSFGEARSVLQGTKPLSPVLCRTNFAGGLLATIGLVTLRARLPWFPLHPMGYALCASWTMIVFWFPCLVAWLCKVLVLHYGGMRAFTRSRPFFLGMVLGEFTMALIWTLPSLFFRTPTPFFPWP